MAAAPPSTSTSSSSGRALVAPAAAHTSHRVTLLASTHVLGEVGAGIQVAPNTMQLLLHWGLDAVQPTAIVFRQYDTGERLGYTRWAPHVVRDHARRSARSGRRRRAEHQARCSIPASSLARTVIRASYRGPSRGPMTSPRRMPHDAGVCYPITSDELQPRDSALFPFSSLTVRSELRSLLKTQRFSAPYCRTSRHSHRFWLFSKLTKTFGEYHPSFTKPLTDLREGYCT